MPRVAPKPGCYGVVAGSGWTGKVIEHGTASPWGHAFLVLPEGKVSEARPSGAGTAELEHYIRKGAVFNDQEPLSDDYRRDICELSTSRHGAPYDWPVIVDLVLRWGLRVKDPLLPPGDNGRFICSQWITVLATELGQIYCPDLARWMVAPRQLGDRLSVRPWDL